MSDQQDLVYKNKLSQIRSEVHALKQQANIILKKHPPISHERRRMHPHYFKERYPLKINWLRQACFHLLAIRYSYSQLTRQHIEEVEVNALRNALTALLNSWEEDLGKQFLEFYEDQYPVHLTMTNIEIAEHFKIIGYILDRLAVFLASDEHLTRKSAALLRIRHKFLVSFCNALNFKQLINDIEQLRPSYAISKDILDLLYLEFDHCIDHLWKQYATTTNESTPNSFELQRSLQLINFIQKLASFTRDKERMLTYKKKHKVWNKYISKQAKDVKKLPPHR